MVRRISARNFCKYLAYACFIAFNFGFHVHEKAILLVTIPLLVQLGVSKSSDISRRNGSLHRYDTDVVRFKILKTVAMWTLMPLLYQPRESLIKHSLFALDVFTTELLLQPSSRADQCWYWVELRKLGNIQYIYEKVYSVLLIGIVVVQAIATYAVEIGSSEERSKVAFYCYIQILPTIAAVINQFMFVELAFDLYYH